MRKADLNARDKKFCNNTYNASAQINLLFLWEYNKNGLNNDLYLIRILEYL